MSNTKTIFEGIYDGESIVDIPRDMHEMWDGRFNPLMKNVDLNHNEHGIPIGKFKITVTFEAGE